MALEELLSSARLWRGDHPTPGLGVAALPSGHPELDRLLPGRGWPGRALTELLLDHHGIGELGLLRPLLRRLGEAGRPVVWIAPPYHPYAPALLQAGIPLEPMRWIGVDSGAEAAWVAEQCLRSGRCGAVLLWPPASPAGRVLRRLQLAAEQGRCPGFLFRPRAVAAQSSPAALRLLLEPQAAGLGVELLKCRGRHPGARACLVP